jgi:hypothetical protein
MRLVYNTCPKQWQPESWLEAGSQKNQARPAEHALLEGLALHFLGEKQAMATLDTALDLCQTKLQRTEVQLARCLMLMAPSATTLEQVQHHEAGIAMFLRCLFVRALEMPHITPEIAHNGQFIRTFGVFALEQAGAIKP